MTKTQAEIRNWFYRLYELYSGDMDQLWQLINRELECTDEQREGLRAEFHNRQRYLDELSREQSAAEIAANTQ